MTAMLQPMKAKRASGPGGRATPGGEEAHALPVWKAFVVQFSRETSARTGTFSGRVEHMNSGRRARFASTRELLAVLRKLLDELGEE